MCACVCVCVWWGGEIERFLSVPFEQCAFFLEGASTCFLSVLGLLRGKKEGGTF